MTPRRLPRGRTRRALLQRVLLFLAVVPLSGSTVLGATLAPDRASRARLLVDAPARVAVGQAIRLRLSVQDVADLAGFETSLRYDAGAVTFRGVSQRASGLRASGRDLRALGPVEIEHGVAFGAYSCPTADCASRRGPARRTGRAATLRLATLEISAERAGSLELRLTGSRFVDADGRSIDVDTTASRRIVVQVVDAGERVGADRGGAVRPIGAPAGGGTLAAPGHERRTRDVTGDGMATLADAAAVRSAWTRARESSDGCARADGVEMVNEDIDGNGCIDVADVQSVVAAFSAPRAERPVAYTPGKGRAERGVLATWVVRSIGDAADAGDATDNTQDAPNGICAAASGPCTLRAAIFEANRHDGPDRIIFDVPDSQAFPNATDPDRVWRLQLSPSRPLPTIYDETGPVTIDGYSQPGATPNTHPLISNARLKIEIVGPGEGETAESEIHAFELTSSDNTLRGLAMYRLWKEIHLLQANDNRIIGNFVGTDAFGTYAYATNHDRTAAVYLEDSAGNDIGGGGNGQRNVVSGNQWSGIYTTGEAANGNRIRNNIVGLSPNGLRRVANAVIGIDLNHGSSRNIVSENVVSGNGREGIEVSHGETTESNEFFDNVIGTNPAGTAASVAVTANGWDTTNDTGGVVIEDGAHSTLFHDNIVAGNIQNSIVIKGGVKSTGEPTEAHHNRIFSNRIGVGAGDQALPSTCPTNGMTCLLTGVRIQSYARANEIGPGNVIGHFDYGVWIDGDHSDRNTVTRNSIHHNRLAGIELTPNGVDPNGPNGLPPAMGPNEGVDHPMIASATATSVSGQACPGCTVEIFRAFGGVDAYGQGELFVGSAVATGAGTFSVTTTGLAAGDLITATATDADGNTSEFALNQRVRGRTLPPPGTRLVVDTFDRTSTAGWGRADLGGRYQIHIPSAIPGYYNVGAGRGTMVLPAGATRIASLGSLSLMDVDGVTQVRFSHLPAGGDQYAYILVRRTVGGAEYRMRVRLATTGGVRLVTRKFVGGSEAAVGGEVLIPGLTPVAGASLWVRVHVTGDSPTTLRMKAWRQGTPEPADWVYTETDSEPTLQRPGPIALRAHHEPTSTRPPVTISWLDFHVRAADPSLGLPDDFVPPTGNVVIDGGAATTADPIVSLELGATDAGSVASMRISSSSAMTGPLLTNAWEGPYAATRSWDLRTPAHGGSGAHGKRYVYVQWRDAAGNWSTVKSDSIVWQ